MKTIFETIRTVISEKAGVEKAEIKPEAYFMEDLNITQMELGEIIMEIEEKLNLEISEELEEIKTVGDLIHAISDVSE